jgi:hypothetical protein
MRFLGSLETHLDCEAAFELLADMAELERWNPNVTASRRTSGRRLCIGSTYECTIRRMGARMTARSTLVDVVRDRSIRYEGTIAGFWSVDSLEFEALDFGCRVVFRNESSPPRFLSRLDPVLDAVFAPQAGRAVAGAERYLASG